MRPRSRAATRRASCSTESSAARRCRATDTRSGYDWVGFHSDAQITFTFPYSRTFTHGHAGHARRLGQFDRAGLGISVAFSDDGTNFDLAPLVFAQGRRAFRPSQPRGALAWCSICKATEDVRALLDRAQQRPGAARRGDVWRSAVPGAALSHRGRLRSPRAQRPADACVFPIVEVATNCDDGNPSPRATSAPTRMRPCRRWAAARSTGRPRAGSEIATSARLLRAWSAIPSTGGCDVLRVDGDPNAGGAYCDPTGTLHLTDACPENIWCASPANGAKCTLGRCVLVSNDVITTDGVCETQNESFPPDACHQLPVCAPGLSSQFSCDYYPPKPDGSPCDDGNTAPSDDVCSTTWIDTSRFRWRSRSATAPISPRERPAMRQTSASPAATVCVRRAR